MNLYRIKRGRDERYYRGKSKFTKFGTYFRKEQLYANLGWILLQFTDEQLSVISYPIGNGEEVDIDLEMKAEEFFEVLNRNEKINNIENE